MANEPWAVFGLLYPEDRITAILKNDEIVVLVRTV